MSERLPTLSVIIPARNEEEHLRASIDSVIAALRFAPRAEVLIIDGDSTDRTGDIARASSLRFPETRVLHNPHRVTAAGFNIGIRSSRGHYIAIVSAHSEVDQEFFAAALRRFDASDADVVGGPVSTQPGRNGALAWLLAQIVSHPFGVGNSRFRIARTAGYVDALPFAVFRREVFAGAGLFDEKLVRNQDTDFFGRVARAGFRVFLDPAVRSTYRARGTVGGLLLQGFRNAYWNVRVWRQNRSAFRWRHAVPAVFATTGWSLGILAAFAPLARLALAIILTAYAVAAFIAALHIAARSGRAIAILLPPLFFVYHLAYGTGTIAGLHWMFGPRAKSVVPVLINEGR